MKHGSLFSGIGGFDLAAEWMGWENIFHCEWNEFGQKVLNYYWPKAISYNDITKTDFTIHRGTVDVLTGGFPCQPYSQAGKRKGKEDERHLWPEMLRAIREIQPKFIVGENVPGLVNWNDGMVFDEVQSQMEAEGYQVTPFLLPAASVGAPHTRERIWFVAYASCYGGSENTEPRCESDKKDYEQSKCLHNKWSSFNTYDNRYQTGRSEKAEKNRLPKISGTAMDTGEFNGTSFSPIATDTNIKGFSTELQPEINDKEKRENERRYAKQHSSNDWRTLQVEGWKNFPTQPPVCDGDDGLSTRLDAITFPQWRIKSIMAGGNAIVPQVALQIFKAIEQYEQIKNKQ